MNSSPQSGDGGYRLKPPLADAPMPDWFYRPVSRPLLFRLSATSARDFALGVMGRLARVPLGPRLIDFLGHMRPDARLRHAALGFDFSSRIGLGPELDRNLVALPALARFGFGFLDLGPISIEPIAGGATERVDDQEGVLTPAPLANAGLAALLPKVIEASRLRLPLLARLIPAPNATPQQAQDEIERLINALAPYVELFAVEQKLAQQAQQRPVLLCVPADLNLAELPDFISGALAAGVQGLLIDGSVAAAGAGRLSGRPARGPALELVRAVRSRFGNRLAIIASGGVHEPADALALLDAGADLVELDTGLVYTGPGLAKRTNDALLFETIRREPPADEPGRRPAALSWLWTLLLGIGMLLGSLMALVIAATRQILPYDESFVCMPREMLTTINDRLLAFMAHDRVSLAGTMVAIGVVYTGLSWFGVRRGAHWAQLAIFVSAFTGFASFFLFLGFGYLDPLHAFVTAILMQILLLAVHAEPVPYTPSAPPALRNERCWQLGLYGQLLLILHGAALLAAGLTISAIGATEVFVPEDLRFMNTTAEVLTAANPRLVPLVAHDRATFGGMLLASGWVFLLPALWGFGSPARWLWWTLCLGGGSAYAAAIGVHLAVGYLDVRHLMPAVAGLGLFSTGLALAYPFLAGGQSPASRGANACSAGESLQK